MDKRIVIVVGIAAAAGVLYIAARGVKGVVSDVVSTAGTAVVDASAGAVIGLGEVVGIPETNQDQCSIDLANGDTWAASFSCPASRFLKSTLGF